MEKNLRKFFSLSFLFFSLFAQEVKGEIFCHDFLKNLQIGEKSEEVKYLQMALSQEKIYGGEINGFFDEKTLESVLLFQEKYKTEIIQPLGLKKATGFVGENTRSKLNEMYGCTKIEIFPLTPKEGDTLFIRINSTNSAIAIIFEKKKIKIFEENGEKIAIIPVTIGQRGEREIKINFASQIFLRKKITILKRDVSFKGGILVNNYTPQKLLSELNQTRKTINQILQIFTEKKYFTKNFVYPLEVPRVSGLGFGDYIFYGKRKISHYGVDLKAATETQILAINDGLVLFSGNLGNYGKTVILDHGWGIISFYSHLERINVKEKEKVKRGQVIGLSGNTGFSTAPHLHFSLIVDKISVDPLSFINNFNKFLENQKI